MSEPLVNEPLVNEERWIRRSERWMGLMLRLYPTDFREEMGMAMVEAYRDRSRRAVRRGGLAALAGVWLQGLGDSVRNGVGERLQPGIGWRRRGNWGRDAERAMRRLARAPVFTLAMVGTLTVGLGAFAMVYAVVQKVLLAPMPYERPDDLYFVWRNYTWFDLERGWLGGTDVAALDTAGGPIVNAVGLDQGTATLGGAAGSEPREISVMISEPDLFAVLGVAPILGRGFAADETGPGRPAVVVLGHDLWREQFGADPAVVGSEVRLNDEPYTVIGVMGRDFGFARHSSLGPPEAADAYVTFDEHLAETNPGAGSYAGLVRATPGAAPEAVAAAVGRVGAMVDERDMDGRGLKLYPVGMKADLVERVRPALVVLGVAGVVLVLVLAVNLAALLLMRAVQREREFAISRALGANPAALAGAALVEGGVLGMLGGACGAFAAFWGTRALVALAPMDLPRRESIAVDWGVAAVVIGTGTLLGLLAGAVPAFWSTRAPLTALLRNAAVRGGGGGHGPMRRALVVLQVALSLVLLSTGGLVVRSFEGLLRADPGFDPAGVLTLRIPVPQQRYPESEDARELHARLHAALAALPGVERVGATSALPLTAEANQTTIRFPSAPGNTGVEDEDAPLVDVINTREGYFDALGIELLAGRATDGRPTGAREVVIDRTLARKFYPDGNALGATLTFGEDSFTVVGVAEHARQYDVHEDGRWQVYARNEDRTFGTLAWAVRTGRTPTSLVPAVRAAVRGVDPQLAVADVQTMEQVVDDSLRQQRVSAVLIAGFSIGALLLAAMGLFGVVSGAVTRRRHELAVRLALGAGHGRVLRLVLGEGMLLVALGLVVGVPGIYLVGGALADLLVGVSPFDPATLAAVAAGLALVAFVACYIPARRVAVIDPAQAFREE